MTSTRRLFCLFSIILSFVCHAQRTNQTYWAYIDRYKNLAIEQMHQYRIPASITLAQGLLESGAGQSTLATRANNHFGIKVGSTWTGPYVLRDDDARGEKFRKYRTARESYEDHSKFLLQRRYQSLFSLGLTDYRGWARGLKAAGYATNPSYAEALIRIIEMYELYRFDTGKFRSSGKSAPSNTTEPDDFFARHTVYNGNKNSYIIVEVGDDMATISRKLGISLRKLYRYNDLPKDYAPTAGDLIYMKKKRKQAGREYRKNPIHIVERNQSLFDIAQLYGIRLKSLCKLNGWDEPQAVQVGDIIRIR